MLDDNDACGKNDWDDAKPSSSRIKCVNPSQTGGFREGELGKAFVTIKINTCYPIYASGTSGWHFNGFFLV